MTAKQINPGITSEKMDFDDEKIKNQRFDTSILTAVGTLCPIFFRYYFEVKETKVRHIFIIKNPYLRYKLVKGIKTSQSNLGVNICQSPGGSGKRGI